MIDFRVQMWYPCPTYFWCKTAHGAKRIMFEVPSPRLIFWDLGWFQAGPHQKDVKTAPFKIKIDRLDPELWSILRCQPYIYVQPTFGAKPSTAQIELLFAVHSLRIIFGPETSVFNEIQWFLVFPPQPGKLAAGGEPSTRFPPGGFLEMAGDTWLVQNPCFPKFRFLFLFFNLLPAVNRQPWFPRGRTRRESSASPPTGLCARSLRVSNPYHAWIFLMWYNWGCGTNEAWFP